MIKKTLILTTILALTACGGGGSDSNNGSNPPIEQPTNTAPTITAAYTTIYMDENSTLSIPLNVQNKEQENLFFEIDSPSYVTASVNASNNLIINTGDVGSDVKGSITVVVKDEGNLRDEVKFNINVKNIVKESDQVVLEISPRNIELLSPKNGQEYPNNLEKNISFNVISKDVNNDIDIYYNLEKTNPYFYIEKNNTNNGFTIVVRPHENFSEDIVENGYETTKVNFTVNNGVQTNTKSIIVTIKELSQETINERLSKLLSDIEALNSFDNKEELALIEFMIEHLENVETITAKEKQKLLADIEEINSNIILDSNSSEITLYKVGGFENGFPRLGIETLLNLSQDGNIEFDNLLNALSSLNLEEIEKRLLIIKEERYKENAEYFEDFIDILERDYDLGFPRLDLSKRFEAEQGLSLFIGNGEVGYLEVDDSGDHNWKAFKRYTFLEGVLAKLYNITKFKIKKEAAPEQGEEG